MAKKRILVETCSQLGSGKLQSLLLHLLARSLLFLIFGRAVAQQLPPPEPPKPMPGSQDSGTILRVTTNEVLVPTLVEKRGGGILYGLKQSDFVLEDNGIPQKIHVQEELDTAPVALVVAVEEGGASVLANL